MTLEEAKQLKPGDRVLVEMEARVRAGEYEDGKVHLEVPVFPNGFCTLADPADIVRKIAPPRRKFRKGDIVSVANGIVKYVVNNEDDGEVLVEEFENEGSDGVYEEACGLTLICAVEDRADRSAAADGSGVTRKGGEV